MGLIQIQLRRVSVPSGPPADVPEGIKLGEGNDVQGEWHVQQEWLFPTASPCEG